MKCFKRLIAIAGCAVIAVLSLSGCDVIFGGSNRCRHGGSYTRGSDESAHYKICQDCGATYDREEHFSELRYDDSEHFNYCVICEYKYGVQEHTLTEWKLDSSRSTRKCTAQYCKYTESCEHADQHYVITDAEHYPVCDNCEYSFTRKKEEHKYSIYTDITDTTHSRRCVCGKVNSIPSPHELQYACDDGDHWQECACGFETGKEACSYGNYLYNENAHYKICSTCNLQSPGEAHSMYLTPTRQRQCEHCDYIQQPDGVLLGTWEYTVEGKTYRLILSSDWSYTITQKSSGETEEQGDYHTSKHNNLDGTVEGIIYLSANTYISYKFAKGETDKFRSEYGYYYKK